MISGSTGSGTSTDHDDTTGIFDAGVEEFGDKVTYSTNTLESAVTVTWPSE